MTAGLSVVVPARNEAERLAETHAALRRSLGGNTEIVLVLDATSEDGTVEVGTRIAELDERVKVEVVDSPGKGGAVAAGVRAASGEIVVLADADLAVDPAQYGPLIEHAAEGALAAGSRSVRGSVRIGEPPLRYLAGRLFNLAVRWLILPGLRDSQCGFKAFRRETFLPVFEGLGAQGWCFDVELIAAARRMGVPVVEVPVRWRYGHGSKLSVMRDAPRVVRELAALRRRFGRVVVP